MDNIQKKTKASNSINQLKFVQPNSLFPHEEVTKKLSNLIEDIQKCGFINNPINCVKIENKFIVLDGHHRLEALKKLNCEVVPIQVVNKSEIKLDHWYHKLDSNSFEKVLEYVNSFDYSISNNKAAISYGKGNFIQQIRINEENFFPYLKGIFNIYKESYFQRKINCTEKMHWIRYNSITLNDVFKFSTNNQLLPCNVTRFCGFNKMVEMKIPLSLLKEPTNQLSEKSLELS